MSPKTVAILSPVKRREIIRENILDHTYTEIATLCHCTIRTIKRDVQQWKREGGFEEFLLDEFFRSYPDMKANFPEKAFDRLCYLLGKTLTRKIEAHTLEEVKVEEKHVNITANLTQYDNAIEEELNRILRANRSKQSVDTVNP